MSSEPLSVSKALLVAALLCGCGDYSNLDVEYFSALPSREDIQSNLPEDPAEPAVRGADVLEKAIRSAASVADIPALGNRAKLYDDTREAAAMFEALADAFVGLVAEVQRHPPTEHEEHRRIWGPFEVREGTGHQARVTIERDPDLPLLFRYRFELLPPGGSDADWVSFIDGEFRAASTAREGAGVLHLDNFVLIGAGLAGEGMAQIEEVDLTYDTVSDPATVEMTLTAILDTLQFDHARYDDGSGSMRFEYEDAFAATYTVNSRWTDTGAGRADAEVNIFLGGTGTLTECWDDLFRLTFRQNNYEEPLLLGDVSACPATPQ